MAKRVLMVLTNASKIDDAAEDGTAGWYLPECAHPYSKFKKAGWSIEFASPSGGYAGVSTSSLDLNDAENKAFWENAECRGFTENTKALKDCVSQDYDIIFFVGGFGVMFDFPLNNDVQRLGSEIYEKNGIVGAVCHGPIALVNIKLSDGTLLVADKEVAGFTNEEEAAIGLLDKLPMHEGAGRSCEDVLIARGAKYTKADPWSSHVAVSGRVITGQNPASAAAVGDAIVNAC